MNVYAPLEHIVQPKDVLHVSSSIVKSVSKAHVSFVKMVISFLKINANNVKKVAYLVNHNLNACNVKMDSCFNNQLNNVLM